MTGVALSISASKWDEAAGYWVAQTQQHATTQEIREQVEQGSAKLFKVEAGGEVRGAFVLRIEHRAQGSEGVILSAAGNVPGVDLIDVLLDHIEARLVDCSTIRFHTAVPALARRMGAKGYIATEIICTKKVNQ